jgi:cytochrome c oxidase subunit 3
MSHDHGGHLKLQYQPALPINNGKLFLWLFLSTEIMFFAALIGVYIVLRFGAPAWPIPSEVHLSEPIGALNTFILICSSVTVVLALEAAKNDDVHRAKMWIWLTFLLGAAFLGIKAFYEYPQKFAHGIYPSISREGLSNDDQGAVSYRITTGRSRIYEKPDLYFLSGVRLRMPRGPRTRSWARSPKKKKRPRKRRKRKKLPAKRKKPSRSAS